MSSMRVMPSNQAKTMPRLDASVAVARGVLSMGLPEMAATTLSFPVAPTDSARAAGLRHVDPNTVPGFSRARRGRAFEYRDVAGRRIREAAALDRIHKLAIPPAWEKVWICPIANGHIQAIGRDARGRKQYRYEPRWFEIRSATKFHRMLDFGQALPRIRAACDRD